MARLIKIRVSRGGGPSFFRIVGERAISGGDTDTVKYCALLARITTVFAFSTIVASLSFLFFLCPSSFSPSTWNFRSFLDGKWFREGEASRGSD